MHWVPGWALLPRWRNRLDFAGLTAGALIPDIELPFYFLLTRDPVLSRGIMHSLFGAFTIDLILGSLLAVTLIPWAVARLSRRPYWRAFFRFYATPARPTRDVLMASVVLGALTHILLDQFTHAYNPVFWPDATGVPGFLLLGSIIPSSLLFQMLLLGPMVWIIWRARPKA